MKKKEGPPSDPVDDAMELVTALHEMRDEKRALEAMSFDAWRAMGSEGQKYCEKAVRKSIADLRARIPPFWGLNVALVVAILCIQDCEMAALEQIEHVLPDGRSGTKPRSRKRKIL